MVAVVSAALAVRAGQSTPGNAAASAGARPAPAVSHAPAGERTAPGRAPAAAASVGTTAKTTGRPPEAAPRLTAAEFARDVEPVLTYICSQCHNRIANAPIETYLWPESIDTHRNEWETILAKVRSYEMPQPDPNFEPLEERDRAAMVAYLDRAFEEADLRMPPDPGRVTARRLNRVEYGNTIRDLLGIDFDAAEEFPPDDSGYGFDTIGDVLTVSPTLMQKYLAAAEQIASRLVGGDPLPSPAIFTRRSKVRRIGDNAVELSDVLAHDAEYIVKVAITGHRGEADPPVTVRISVDGRPIRTAQVPVQISAVNRQGGATQRAVEEARVFLTGNRHVFRAEFVDDTTLERIPVASRRNPAQNIYPEFIDVAGPYAPASPVAAANPALVCPPDQGRGCARRILEALAHRAYRRPVTRADADELLAVYDRAQAAGYGPRQRLQFALTAMLVSPSFLFRIERDPAPGRIAPLRDVELASRLSYFLWSSMPDEPLLRLAESNRLHEPAVLRREVARMLADPKSRALAEHFGSQWLETRSLDAITRDAERYPEWTPELRDAMRTETTMFFDAILRGDRPVTDFIDAKYTFLNELLARHYGIGDVKGPEFRRVELSTDQRGGVFTQASVLTVSAYPTRTSVVLRGKYLLENVFNTPPPPPPADVPALDEAAVGTAGTLRQRMEAHRTQAICASCHTRMDPLGFALENYDATGKWRTGDGKFPIDSSGAFPNGRTFSGPAELKALLLESAPDFTKGLAEKMLTYALGRGVEPFDRPAIRAIVRQTTAAEFRLQALVLAIVESTPFQQRRGPARPAAEEARRP
ncbi:MAG: DUF1592 domain-containing protein [Acidobacteria bacterium]|nr:DUF1592 domain-containing protein [Acidobacteriota bacterium]